MFATEPDPVLEERVALELERRERREAPAEAHAERQAHGVGVGDRPLCDQPADQSEEERTAHVDEQGRKGKRASIMPPTHFARM